MTQDELRATIGIPYYVMNFREEFQKSVIDYFATEYLTRTDTEPVYCLQPLCEMGSTACREAFPSERIILQQAIMQE